MFVGVVGLIVMAFLSLVLNHELILSQERLHSLAWMITALFGCTVLFYMIVMYPFKDGQDPFIKLFHFLPGKKLFLLLGAGGRWGGAHT